MPTPPMPTKWTCWYRLKTRVPVIASDLGPLRDVQEQPTAAIATRSEDPPEDTNGSGSPFVGRSPTTTHMLTTAWVTRSAETPKARSEPNGSATRRPIRMPRHRRSPKRATVTDRADEPELLAEDREDEVRVRLGEVEELLLRLPESSPQKPPAAEREVGLDDLEPGPPRVRPGVEEREDPPEAVGRHPDGHDDDRDGQGADQPEVCEPRPGDEDHAEDHADDGHRRAEVRLEEDQPGHPAGHDQGRDDAPPQVPDRPPAAGPGSPPGRRPGPAWRARSAAPRWAPSEATGASR